MYTVRQYFLYTDGRLPILFAVVFFCRELYGLKYMNRKRTIRDGSVCAAESGKYLMALSFITQVSE